MARNWYFVPVTLLISGCVTADLESTQPPSTSEIQAANVSPASLQSLNDGTKDAPLNHTPSKEEICAIQIHMKAAGVNPGALDGIMGPKTITALHRFQSGCAMINDVLIEHGEGSQENNEKQTPQLTTTVTRIQSTDDVWVLQSRLKAAGFDPGPIDGIMGPKTKSTLGGVQSGCALAKLFAKSSSQTIQPVESTFNSKKRLQPVALRYPAASEPSKDSRPTPTMNRTPSQDEIQLIQVRLKDAGFDPGPIDGVMGPKTRTAIQRYRMSRGLTNAPMPSSGIDGMFE